jgi:uncharacterized protein (TIGR02001 family)
MRPVLRPAFSFGAITIDRAYNRTPPRAGALMKTGSLVLAAVLVAANNLAQAQFSSTVTLVSDYEFRGVSLARNDPALQASLDYQFVNGVAIGAWASNLDYGDDYDGDFELDFYASYTAEISETASWSAGLTAYTYPDSSAQPATATQDARLKIEPYLETYVDITVGPFNAAQWYADDFSGLGASAQYTEINLTHELPRNFSVAAHVGYSWGDYWRDDGLGGGELFDYSLGATYHAGHFALGAKLTGTDASGDRKITSGAFRNDARFLVSIATTFPWEM